MSVKIKLLNTNHLMLVTFLVACREVGIPIRLMPIGICPDTFDSIWLSSRQWIVTQSYHDIYPNYPYLHNTILVRQRDEILVRIIGAHILDNKE